MLTHRLALILAAISGFAVAVLLTALIVSKPAHQAANSDEGRMIKTDQNGRAFIYRDIKTGRDYLLNMSGGIYPLDQKP